jgi:hypothetical protein
VFNIGLSCRWRCPECDAVCRKNLWLTAKAARGARIVGHVACRNCGRTSFAAAVYGGEFDVDQIPAGAGLLAGFCLIPLFVSMVDPKSGLRGLLVLVASLGGPAVGLALAVVYNCSERARPFLLLAFLFLVGAELVGLALTFLFALPLVAILGSWGRALPIASGIGIPLGIGSCMWWGIRRLKSRSSVKAGSQDAL